MIIRRRVPECLLLLLLLGSSENPGRSFVFDISRTAGAPNVRCYRGHSKIPRNRHAQFP
jgi:hypothetical protein